jgi:prolyl-tRNA editing enzyme YbaK/EbsC (Cys-tRNA(Pro) deacylase)
MMADAADQGTDQAAGSVERVRAALLAAGHPDTIEAFPEGTRTAAEAAAAIGCRVEQIAKSIVFRAGDEPVVVIASGTNRVDAGRAAAALGMPLGRADAAFVRRATGFAIGGVAPVGHLTPPRVLIDRDLLALDPVWAAAGSPSAVFRTRAAELLRLTGGMVADVRQDQPAGLSPSGASD